MTRTGFAIGPLRLFSLLAIAGLGTWLHACGPRERGSPSESSFNPGRPPAEFADGERFFNDTCSQCHGALGMGTKQGPPLVHTVYRPSHHSDEAFRRAVAFGVPAHHWSFGPMPPIRLLNPDDVEPIIRYVRWLQGKAGIQ